MVSDMEATPSVPALAPETVAFYQASMRVLRDAGQRFLVGGAYAFAPYTGIERHTKDLDLFVHPTEIGPVLDALAGAGYRCELPFPHWLGKAWKGDDFVDLIFSSGSGVAVVDDAWFTHSVPAKVFDVDANLVPAEEMIWSKAFIMERERYDGNDVAHILRARAEHMDWRRLLDRFGEHWRVLLSHVVLYGFVYPSERGRIPAEVLAELLGRLLAEMAQAPPADRLCRGTLLSRSQYLTDIGKWGYRDVRLAPQVRMRSDDIERWTRGIAKDGSL
jgi:hypothetical protein